jgi:hypothetical protein
MFNIYIYIYIYIGKVNLSLCLTNEYIAMKPYGAMDTCFIDLGSCWMIAAELTPLEFNSRGKNRQYQSNRRLRGPRSRSGRCGGVKLLTLPEFELWLLGHPAHTASC